ncbi:MAG: hypothetical protein IV106_29085 [Pseudomonas umsongensis]|nr:hypothetical protein [Pseudomonas umsongensis]
MKERPILFNAPMVRAILEGQKTVTRRALKMPHGLWETSATGELVPIPVNCPYGQPGDRLWVRETYQVSNKYDAVKPCDLDYDRGISTYYAAGGSRSKGSSSEYEDYDDVRVPDWVGKIRPSIFMPRAACRILLEVTTVRVERLQDITEEQARAEGITDGGCNNCGNHEPCGCECPAPSAVDSFVHLWNSTGGDWDENPWVWVIEFKRVTPP